MIFLSCNLMSIIFQKASWASGKQRTSPGIFFNNCFAVVFVCFSHFPIHPADHFQSSFTHKINILFNLNQEDRRPVQWHPRTSHWGNCIKLTICLWNKALDLCFLWMYLRKDRGGCVIFLMSITHHNRWTFSVIIIGLSPQRNWGHNGLGDLTTYHYIHL